MVSTHKRQRLESKVAYEIIVGLIRNAMLELYKYTTLYSTGCPKSKVTILIFNNFLMKEVV